MKKEDLLKDEFLKQFKTGEELTSFLKSIQKRGIEKMLEGELDAHLDYEKHQPSDNTNSGNGYTSKKVKTSLGETSIKVPRDREASFNPMLVPKRTNMVDGIENVIISLYAKGMSNSDIEEQIREVYDFDISTSTISRITDKVTNDIVAWQNRVLEPVYLITWMDGIVFKVRKNSKVINKTMYIAVGLRRDGKKEVLGLWLGKNESAAFWMSVLTDIKARGVEDLLITATDNLNGFTQTIKNVFPESTTQICVVHQIRNASREVSNNPKHFPYLLRKHVISYANSANLLFTDTYSHHTPNKLKECLAFSFSGNKHQEAYAVQLAELRNRTDDLPGTRKEIRAIADIIDGKYFYGTQANEANFKENVSQYSILHLALHGEVNNEHPENSKLYFTKSNDSLEDDQLYGHELFALTIPAELTVLSACNTGTGKIAKGEGIMSLGNAFQYAGTKSLLLSNWEISDQTTPELMKYFYANLKTGMNKAKALQQAKLKYLNTAHINYMHPFYWSGFYLVGNSDPITLSTNNTLYWIFGILTCCVILVLGVFLYRKRMNTIKVK